MADNLTDDTEQELNDIDPFEAPPVADFFNLGDHWDKRKKVGALLAIQPEEHKEGMHTVHGESDVIICNVHVIDWEEGEDTGTSYEGTMIFSLTLVPALKKRIGTMVLARLGVGEAQKGMNAPWRLLPVEKGTADHKKALAWYREYMASKRKDPFE